MIYINHPLYQKDLKAVIPYIEKMIECIEAPRILVIGATGLIGSFLTDALIYYNSTIQECIQIGVMSRSENRLLERFGYYLSKKIDYIEQEIQDKLDDKAEWDFIFHLASNADPNSYERYPYETITTNVLGTNNVIEYAKKHLNTKILFTSTMEVYGEALQEKLQESDYGALDFNKIRSGYPESKRVSELMYRSAAEEFHIKCVIARMGYVYGSTMTDSDNKVVAQLIRSAAGEGDFVLKSAGVQKRTYCYVADAVSGLLSVITKGENGECYNIADEASEITIRGLAEIFAEIQNNVVYFEKNKYESKVFHKVLDMSKVKSLQWRAETSLKRGIYKTINIYSEGKIGC